MRLKTEKTCSFFMKDQQKKIERKPSHETGLSQGYDQNTYFIFDWVTLNYQRITSNSDEEKKIFPLSVKWTLQVSNRPAQPRVLPMTVAWMKRPGKPQSAKLDTKLFIQNHHLLFSHLLTCNTRKLNAQSRHSSSILLPNSRCHSIRWNVFIC